MDQKKTQQNTTTNEIKMMITGILMRASNVTTVRTYPDLSSDTKTHIPLSRRHTSLKDPQVLGLRV